jgi:hypothetical protein
MQIYAIKERICIRITQNAVVDYNKKIKSIRNTIQLVGINQFTTPILTDNPETTWRLNGAFGKKYTDSILK